MDVHTPRQPVAVNQFASPTHDGKPDENRGNNCTEGCTVSGLDLYGHRRTDGSLFAPDDLKDWAIGQDVAGVQGNSTTVQNMLAHFGPVPSVTQTVTAFWNKENGLMDRIWQSLHDRGAPAWCAVWWVDANGVVYNGQDAPEIGHWRLCWRLTDTGVYTMDPGFGSFPVDSWQHFWAISRKVLVVPTVAPPGFA